MHGFRRGMLQETRVAAEELPSGAKLTVRAAAPERVRELQRTTRERLEAMRRSK